MSKSYGVKDICTIPGDDISGRNEFQIYPTFIYCFLIPIVKMIERESIPLRTDLCLLMVGEGVNDLVGEFYVRKQTSINA